MSRAVDPGQIVRELTGVEVGLTSGVVRCTACKETVEGFRREYRRRITEH